MLIHKHLIVNADVKKCFQNEDSIELFISYIIDTIGMNIAKTRGRNPNSYYCDLTGNVGHTAVGILETSHCAIHQWDDVTPHHIQFDLYSCADFDVEQILDIINQRIGIIDADWVLLNRGGTNIVIEDKGEVIYG